MLPAVYGEGHVRGNSMEYNLAPSILSADFTHLGEDILAVKRCGAKYLHFDVMDGLFVPSISFGMPVLKSIRPLTDMFYDVHLMIKSPERYVEDFADAGADGITVHAEACVHLDRVLDQIHDRGLKTGIALNPATSLSVLDYVCEKADMILLMTVNPGFAGQGFIDFTRKKVIQLAKLKEQYGFTLMIDGHCSPEIIDDLASAGADGFILGTSALFRKGRTYAELIRELRKGENQV